MAPKEVIPICVKGPVKGLDIIKPLYRPFDRKSETKPRQSKIRFKLEYISHFTGDILPPPKEAGLLVQCVYRRKYQRAPAAACQGFLIKKTTSVETLMVSGSELF
ncbi:MAG: hypothetical protein LBU32_31405 [Clostridiales bacterium]|jgi:hypothetical protein|nr:hypothetical protein [Clostridiales bacterium]